MNPSFPGGSVVKNLPANARDTRDGGWVPGWEDPPEEEMAPYSRVLAWRIPWTEEPGGRKSTRLQRAGQDLASKQFSDKTPATIPRE